MTLTAMLALATGLPVVATDHSGFPDVIVDGKNGYLAKEGNPEDIAEKILEYMNHPERWPGMSEAGRAHMLAKYDQKVLIDRQLAEYRRIVPGVKKIAFVVGEFPGVPGAFILNQVADLMDRGVAVTIFSFKDGSLENVSDRYYSYHMATLVHSMDMPKNYFSRIARAVPKFLHVFSKNPAAAFRALNVFRYGTNALSLKNLFRAEPFADAEFDLVHCHMGPVANRYLVIKDVLGLKQKIITTFYGYDVSMIPKQKGPHYYDRLKKETSLVFVMSENMKSRVKPLGFDEKNLITLPVAIDVPSYPFAKRSVPEDGVIKIVSAGRFVEKKGFDDLLRALAIVKKKSPLKFRCYIVGEGVEGEKLRALAKELAVEDVLEWRGFMKEQDLLQYYMDKHLFVQTSKTASNGDME